jgi:hypothetical protein
MDENNEISRKSMALNRSIRERLNRPTLTEEVQAQNEQNAERKMSWMTEVRQNWFVYFLLAMSAVFTGMLGVFMGLTPHLVTNLDGSQSISFNTDFGHVVTAILYCLAFVTITEGAFIAGKWKFHTREENNGAQTITMLLVMALALVSIVVTGYAGGQVVASTLGFLSEFKEIPAWAQEWVVKIIPVLFGVYAPLFVVYWLSSKKPKHDRIAKQTKERMQQEHRLQMEMIEISLEEELMLEEAEMYQRLVRDGKLTVSQARAARRAKKSLPELEQELGRDLDNDGHVGDRPASKQRPGLWVDEEEYRRLSQKYPHVPGTFMPDDEAELERIKRNGRNP